MQQNTRLESLGSAAAGIAHDINNHLMVIMNHLAMENVEGARMAVSRCASLASGLLSYCRGESIHPRALDPSVFLRDFAAAAHLPENMRLHLRISQSRDIVADPAALTRILHNLVINASDAMDQQGIVRIGVSGTTIFVEDNGPGIPSDIARRIFDPFFTTKGTRGTGLGLAIVREIMAEHAGSVTLHSQPGQGARFELRFRPAPSAVQPIH